MSTSHRPSMVALAATVLRDPVSLLSAADDREAFAHVAPRALGIGAIAAALVGATVGSYYGGPQVVAAAVKVPVLLGASLIVALPAVKTLAETGGVEVPWRRLALAGVLGVARTALLGAAAGPLMWLFYGLGPSYRLSVLAFVAMLVVTGLPALTLIGKALPAGAEGRLAIRLASAAVFGLVLAQTGYVLRPFVHRTDREFALLRPIEGDIADAVGTTTKSVVTGDRGRFEPTSEPETTPMWPEIEREGGER